MGTLNDVFNDTKKTVKKSVGTNKAVLIPVKQIEANPNNHWERRQFTEDEERVRKQEYEELKDSIERIGLQQPIVLLKLPKSSETGVMYRILTGERRFNAVTDLGWENVLSVIKSLEDTDLPISDELKEESLINETNIHNRTKFESDILYQIEWEKRYFTELKAGLKKQGKSLPGKTRDLIARKLGISPSTVHRYEAINKKASEDVKKAFSNGKIDLSTTTEIVKLPKDDQDEILHSASETETVTTETVSEFKNKKEKENLGDEILKKIFSSLFDTIKCSTIKEYEKCLKDKYKNYGTSVDGLLVNGKGQHLVIQNAEKKFEYTWLNVVKKAIEFEIISVQQSEKNAFLPPASTESKSNTPTESDAGHTPKAPSAPVPTPIVKEVLDYGQIELLDKVSDFVLEKTKNISIIIEDSKQEYPINEKEKITKIIKDLYKIVETKINELESMIV